LNATGADAYMGYEVSLETPFTRIKRVSLPSNVASQLTAR